jgi:hypothetical protein
MKGRIHQHSDLKKICSGFGIDKNKLLLQPFKNELFLLSIKKQMAP